MNKKHSQGIYLVVVAVSAISLTFLIMFPFIQGSIKENENGYRVEQLPDSGCMGKRQDQKLGIPPYPRV